MKQEEWKPFKWGYEVSSKGRVKSPRGSILAPREDRFRPTVQIGRVGKKETHKVGEMVLKAFGVFGAEGMVLKFRDGDHHNPSLDNVYWAEPDNEPRTDTTIYKNSPDAPSIAEFPVQNLKGTAPKHIQERVKQDKYENMVAQYTNRPDGMPQILLPFKQDKMIPVTLPRVAGFYE